MPTATSLMTIYQTFLDGHLNNGGFDPKILALSSALIKGALGVSEGVWRSYEEEEERMWIPLV